jgi:hypothetical protein
MGVKTIVDMAVEAMGAMKPGASTEEDSTDKPVRPVVAVRRTVIRWIVEVAIRADGSRSNIYSDSNLSVRHWCATQERNCENCEYNRGEFEHNFSSIELEFPSRLQVACTVRYFSLESCADKRQFRESDSRPIEVGDDNPDHT